MLARISGLRRVLVYVPECISLSSNAFATQTAPSSFTLFRKPQPRNPPVDIEATGPLPNLDFGNNLVRNSRIPREQSLRLYRRLLRESQRFFDPHTQDFLRMRIQLLFRRHRNDPSVRTAIRRVAEARSQLRRLIAANGGDHVQARYFLSHAYALTGRLCHMLNKPLLPPTATSKRNMKIRIKKENSIIVNDQHSGIRINVNELLKRKGKPGRHHPRPILPDTLATALEENLKSRPRWKHRLYKYVKPKTEGESVIHHKTNENGTVVSVQQRNISRPSNLNAFPNRGFAAKGDGKNERNEGNTKSNGSHHKRN